MKKGKTKEKVEQINKKVEDAEFSHKASQEVDETANRDLDNESINEPEQDNLVRESHGAAAEEVKQPDELTDLKEKVAELQSRLLRNQADFENYKKRTRTEKEEFAKYASVKLIESLLPAMDNFSRALMSGNETTNLDSLIKGVEMVYRQIEEVLAKEGLEKIEALGQPFNPEFHQAVMQVEDSEYGSGTVVEEFQKGYLLKGKIIRPAMVKVNT